jgi:hypothetical protein
MPSSRASARCHSQISGKKEPRQPGSRARPDQLHTLQIKTITSQGGATLVGKRRTGVAGSGEWRGGAAGLGGRQHQGVWEDSSLAAVRPMRTDAQRKALTAAALRNWLPQGASLGAFMALLDVEAVHGPVLWDEVRRTRRRRSSFQVHAGKNRQLDGCAAELGKVVEACHGRGEIRHILLAWGAGQLQSSLRGNPAAPTSQIQRAMSRLYRVVEVDEAYTSPTTMSWACHSNASEARAMARSSEDCSGVPTPSMTVAAPLSAGMPTLPRASGGF